MAADTLNPHAGDHGYWLELVRGDPANTGVWNTLVPEILVRTPWPGSTVRAVAADHISIDRGAAVIRWLLADGDLPRAGQTTVQVADIQAGQRRVLSTLTFPVDEPLIGPDP